MSSNDLERHVRSIADELSTPPESYCELCGCFLADTPAGDDCMTCGEGTRTTSAFDWLEGALDIEYVVNGAGEYLGARVLVTFGGPNIWVNTRTNQVEGHWWQDSARCGFDDSIGLDDCLSELWECR